MARPVLTSAQMRAAEASVILAGTPETLLMERAGAALAEAVRLYAGPRDTLVLCGPGNNGGDGYVAARHLQAKGYPVRVAALSEPSSAAAIWASEQWQGPVESFQTAGPGEIVIDCLFGTGLSRGLDCIVTERLSYLIQQAVVAVACDIPSGVESDQGSILSPVERFDITVTFGALKPSHRLMPSMRQMGRVVLADIGVDAPSWWREIGRPVLPPLDAAGHKFDRGMVAILAGAMPGAAALAASAAARSGAGYVKIHSERTISGVPAAIVQGHNGDLNDRRIGALLVGPGLGQGGRSQLNAALASGHSLILDADALGLLTGPDAARYKDAILTPHEGEFSRLFGPAITGPKHERALEAARQSDSVVVLKGPDTVVAAPDGRLGFGPPAPAWLASAGTGDVLAGIAAALRARGLERFEAACGAVWIHGRAAELAGTGMIADDLLTHIPDVLE